MSGTNWDTLWKVELVYVVGLWLGFAIGRISR